LPGIEEGMPVGVGATDEQQLGRRGEIGRHRFVQQALVVAEGQLVDGAATECAELCQVGGARRRDHGEARQRGQMPVGAVRRVPRVVRRVVDRRDAERGELIQRRPSQRRPSGGDQQGRRIRPTFRQQPRLEGGDPCRQFLRQPPVQAVDPPIRTLGLTQVDKARADSEPRRGPVQAAAHMGMRSQPDDQHAAGRERATHAGSTP
jgi:hypothetical protein